jgi:hypothetical protein
MLKERLEMEDCHGTNWPGKPVIVIEPRIPYYIDDYHRSIGICFVIQGVLEI